MAQLYIFSISAISMLVFISSKTVGVFDQTIYYFLIMFLPVLWETGIYIVTLGLTQNEVVNKIPYKILAVLIVVSSISVIFFQEMGDMILTLSIIYGPILILSLLGTANRIKKHICSNKKQNL